jgi:hypothetical protein
MPIWEVYFKRQCLHFLALSIIVTSSIELCWYYERLYDVSASVRHFWIIIIIIIIIINVVDRLCGLVVSVPCYRSRGPGFDSRRYQIFWDAMGLEQGPLSLVSKIEELFGRNSSGSGLEKREYGRGDPLRWPFDTLYPQELALTSPTSGGRSICIVRSRTKAAEFI